MKNTPVPMSLSEMLEYLVSKGCFPCVSFRGHIQEKEVWRAHINGAGNQWDEASTPELAMKNAVNAWEKNGCPMDGYAREAQT